MTPLALAAIRNAVEPMLHNRLQNYIVPGLTSHLVGGDEFGKVRLFQTDRSAQDFITPHSHRFDFTCLVLAGSVVNTLYVRGAGIAEPWCMSTIDQVCGNDGLRKYVHTRDDSPTLWGTESYRYGAGDTYHMPAAAIHSIKFTAGSRVLFFEGPQITPRSTMLEPWVDGKVVPTFKTEVWMFDKSPHVKPVKVEDTVVEE